MWRLSSPVPCARPASDGKTIGASCLGLNDRNSSVQSPQLAGPPEAQHHIASSNRHIRIRPLNDRIVPNELEHEQSSPGQARPCDRLSHEFRAIGNPNLEQIVFV